MTELIQFLDGLAGFAALINSLILWPIVKRQNRQHEDTNVRLDNHEGRIKQLEAA